MAGYRCLGVAKGRDILRKLVKKNDTMHTWRRKSSNNSMSAALSSEAAMVYSGRSNNSHARSRVALLTVELPRVVD